MNRQEAAQLIDHAVLDPNNTSEDVVQGIKTGIVCRVKSICVYPNSLKTLVQMLACNEDTIPSVVVNYPHGCGNLHSVEYEVMDYLTMGAKELDIVVDQTAISSQDDKKISKFASRLLEKARGVPCKFILETGRWSNEELENAVVALLDAGACFLKTTTGYGPQPTMPSEVQFLSKLVKEYEAEVQLKAAGGIKSRSEMETMLSLGAHRIGTSSTAKILSQF